MTRLITEWILDIHDTIKEKEAKLKRKTGLDFVALAAKSGGWSIGDIERAAQQIKVGVVPITSGQGIISSFAESVATVTETMGFRSFVTENRDVSGIQEAYEREADILYMADDDKFVSINLHKKRIVDNNNATAAGYLAALEGAQGSLTGKEVLLLGYGVLGQEFLKRLQKKGVAVTGFDINKSKMKEMERTGAAIITGVDQIAKYQLIIDATSLGGWIHGNTLHPEAWLIAPGIPLSLDKEAYQANEDRVIHDYLEIGTAAMLGLTL